jgi:hypothetical protein
MASEVDICNLALANIGDPAQVTSITSTDVTPNTTADGSLQASLCSTFYFMARNALLEMHDWAFATERVDLGTPIAGAGVLDVNGTPMEPPEWQYVYTLPSDCLDIIAVLPPNMSDDYSITLGDFSVGPHSSTITNLFAPMQTRGVYTPQGYQVETNSDGVRVLLTNQEYASLRYTALVTDTTTFSSTFVIALSWYLASFLAGPLIKGKEGMAVAANCLKMMEVAMTQARNYDSTQRSVKPTMVVPWIANR